MNERVAILKETERGPYVVWRKGMKVKATEGARGYTVKKLLARARERDHARNRVDGVPEHYLEFK